MRRLAIGIALTVLSAVTRAQAPPSDLESMRKRLDQLESLVGQLQTQLDAERSASGSAASARGRSRRV